MYGRGAGAYKQTDVLTADPKRLVILSYEAAIYNLKSARGSYEVGAYEAKAKALHKAQAIIGELAAALNFEKGGQIAKNLSALYAYMQRTIIKADIDKDLAGIDQVVGMMEELKSAWDEAFFGNREDVVAAPRLGRLPGVGQSAAFVA